MESDYKVQVSLKFGRNQEGMLNIRGDSVDEVDNQCRYFIEEALGSVLVLAAALRAESVVAESFPGTTRVDSQGGSVTVPASTYPPADAPPRCGPDGSHGFMKRQESKTARPGDSDYWWGWFCPQPQGQPRCKPVYPNKR